MAHAFNSSTQEAKANVSSGVQGQPGLCSELQNSQSYTVRHLSPKPKTGVGELNERRPECGGAY